MATTNPIKVNAPASKDKRTPIAKIFNKILLIFNALDAKGEEKIKIKELLR